MRYGTLIFFICLFVPLLIYGQQRTYTSSDYQYQLDKLSRAHLMDKLINYVKVDPSNPPSRRYLIHLAFELHRDYNPRINKLENEVKILNKRRQSGSISTRQLKRQLNTIFQQEGTSLIEGYLRKSPTILNIRDALSTLQVSVGNKSKNQIDTKKMREIERRYLRLSKEIQYTRNQLNKYKIFTILGSSFIGASILFFAGKD